jgi:hypothetical protein
MNFIKTKLNKITKKELIKAEKEKKRCQKLYSDWKDDEYNCGPLRYIWGIQHNGEDTNNFNTLNDLDICFNRDTKKYILSLDSMVIMSPELTKHHLEFLLDKFSKLIGDKLEYNFNPYGLNMYDTGELFIADSLTELYYKFKIFVKGYEQL